MTTTVVIWLVSMAAVAGMILGFLSARAGYHNGFWDGVIWERDRDGMVWPPPQKCKLVHTWDKECEVCAALYPPGGESLYPSKPGPSWGGWVSLAAGARAREAKP